MDHILVKWCEWSCDELRLHALLLFLDRIKNKFGGMDYQLLGRYEYSITGLKYNGVEPILAYESTLAHVFL